jgi:UDP-N-acetylmuramoyl-tripeptide--D-alanyl-D-alanine ligase
VALPGEKKDGHEFVAQAFAQGAIAALVHRPVEAGDVAVIRADESSPAEIAQLPVAIQVEETLRGLQRLAAFWREKFTARVIGVTGSVGKSTTKELIAAVLSTRLKTLKNAGNLNNEIGLPLTLLKLDDSYERVVLEMGMYDVGEIALLCDIARPQVGVVTNVGPTHLERLGTIERIVQAKTELVQALPLDGVAILNADDPLVAPMAGQTRARILTYGLTPTADLSAEEVTSAGLEGIRFAFRYQGERIEARLPLLGRHNVYTALRAAAVGLVEGLSWTEIVAGLEVLPSAAQLRLTPVPGPNGSTLLDDTYNASPASTLAALNLLAELEGGRKIALLGDMLELGSYEEEGHRQVGRRAAGVVDALIVIGSRAGWIAAEARRCGLEPARILAVETHQAAVAHLAEFLRPGDWVLLKGSRSLRLDEVVAALADGS